MSIGEEIMEYVEKGFPYLAAVSLIIMYLHAFFTQHSTRLLTYIILGMVAVSYVIGRLL